MIQSFNLSGAILGYLGNRGQEKVSLTHYKDLPSKAPKTLTVYVNDRFPCFVQFKSLKHSKVPTSMFNPGLHVIYTINLADSVEVKLVFKPGSTISLGYVISKQVPFYILTSGTKQVSIPITSRLVTGSTSFSKIVPISTIMAGSNLGVNFCTAATVPNPYPLPLIKVTTIGGKLSTTKSGVGKYLITNDAAQKSQTGKAPQLLSNLFLGYSCIEPISIMFSRV